MKTILLLLVSFLIAHIAAASVLAQQAQARAKECSESHHEMNFTECVDLAHRCPNRKFTFVGPGCTKYCYICIGTNCRDKCLRAPDGAGCRVDDDYCAFTCENKCVGLRLWGNQACMWDRETQRCLHYKDTTFDAQVVSVPETNRRGDIRVVALLALLGIFGVLLYACAPSTV